MKNMNVTVPNGTSELIVRQGLAETITEREKYTFSGLIDAPGIFYTKRVAAKPTSYFDPSVSVVMVDLDARTIVLVTDTTHPKSDVITGTMFAESMLEQFRFNDASRGWRPADLAACLRRNRQHFAEPEKCAQLVAELTHMKIKSNGEIEVNDDNRGNVKRLFDQKITTTIPVSFALNMPILSGGPKRRFTVDIHLDVQGGSVTCYLESIDLAELTMTDIRTEMEKQVQIFAESGIPILFK